MIQVKICGLRETDHVSCAVESGVRMLGFVFVEASPRYVKPEDAKPLVYMVPEDSIAVGLFADHSCAQIKKVLETVPIGIIQLHGQESPEDVSRIKDATGLPIMKAVGIADIDDLRSAEQYIDADIILFDHKPGTGLSGGTGKTAPWHIIRQWNNQKPYMLAGGLHKGNLAAAYEATNAQMYDVSSGVEVRRGVKDCALIRDFMAVAQNLEKNHDR